MFESREISEEFLNFSSMRAEKPKTYVFPFASIKLLG